MVDWFSIAIWSLLGTWILVVGTLVLLYWQTRQAQHLNSANAVMNLRERFDAPRMRAARRHLADHLLRHAHEDLANVEVVNFFELVGTLTHRRVLDADLVWEAFGSWIEAYYWAIRNPADLVGQLRSKLSDPWLYHEFEWLHQRLLDLDKSHAGPHPGPSLDPGETARQILSAEVSLESIQPQEQ